MTNASTNKEPIHHRRYRIAWSLYRDKNLNQDLKKNLEKEMDSAQNYFQYSEFQEFKKTLPGFIEFWDNFYQDSLEQAKMVLGVELYHEMKNKMKEKKHRENQGEGD